MNLNSESVVIAICCFAGIGFILSFFVYFLEGFTVKQILENIINAYESSFWLKIHVNAVIIIFIGFLLFIIWDGVELLMQYVHKLRH